MNSHRVSAQEPRISEEEVQYFISWLELNRPDLAKKAEQKKLFEESLNPPSFRWFRNLVLLYLAESEKSLNPPKRRFPWLRNLVWLVLAESEKSLQPPKSRFRWLRKLVLADPEDFHGKSFVTEELEKHSKITAGFVSGTNLLNFFTNSPLFYYAFEGIGSGPAFILMLAVDLIILKLTNFCGTAAAGGKKGIRCWSLTAVIAFMTMGILQSVVSGMGVELINNRSTLATLRAEEIINKQKNKLQSKYKEAKKDLNKKEEELKSEKNPDNRTHI